MSSSEFTFIQIGSSNRSADVLRCEIWRTVNAVGNCLIVLRNTDGKYNGVFDVQDTITITITDPDGNNQIMFRGRVDGGGAVEHSAGDGESIWDEYIIVRGVDKWQDMLFHNDYDEKYPASATQIKTVLGDLFTAPKAISTNIDYFTPAGATPVIGSVEFREGSGFLSSIQDTLQKAGFIAYVDDGGTLRAGAPGFSASAETITNTGASRNIIGKVEFTEADGGKLYNYIKLTGKNPMFDGFTEENADSWFSPSHPGNIEDSTSNVKVGSYSQRVYNTNPLTPFTPLAHKLSLPEFNYDTWDFSKGEIGIWCYYDNQAASGGGEPAVGQAAATENVECRLEDSNGITVSYWDSTTTKLYRGDWGWCTFPLGQTFRTGVAGVDGEWCTFGFADFDWSSVETIRFDCSRWIINREPSNFYIDGISLPVPVIGLDENVASQTAYRRRPLTLPMPHLVTYNTLQAQAEQLLAQSKDSNIDYLKTRIEGNVDMIYAGQNYTVDIPELTLNSAIFYVTQLHHIIEPMVDVSDGFGFDFITEVEGSPIYGVAYDMSRLGDRQVYSPTQIGQFSGTGLAIK